MADDEVPFRLRIMMALTDLLKTITPANGYNFDLSDQVIEEDDERGIVPRVYRGRFLFGDDDPLPFVAILEHNDMLDQRTTQQDNPVYQGPLDIIIQGFVSDNKEFPTDPAQYLLADIKKLLGKEKHRKKPMSHQPDYLGLGDRETNCITDFAVGPGSVRPPGELSANAFCYVVLSLGINEDTSRPYD